MKHENSIQRFRSLMVETYTKMAPAEFMKYDWRIDVFLDKFKNKKPFHLASGKEIIFDYNPTVEKIMKSRNQRAMRDIILLGSDGVYHKLSALGKDKDFGGKGAGFAVRSEEMELTRFNDQLDDIKSRINRGVVPVKIGNTIYEVAAGVITPGTPKSDFHLVDYKGNEIVWISHKKGRTPKDFQQYGGVSRLKEPNIHNHPEVQAFINDLKEKYPNGLDRATSFYRTIKDSKLKNLSVYGNDYGRALGRQNVSILLQGPVKLTKSGKNYVFTSNQVYYNGDEIDGGYEPVLAAIYKGDRDDAGIKGTRIVIMAKDGRTFKGEI